MAKINIKPLSDRVLVRRLDFTDAQNLANLVKQARSRGLTGYVPWPSLACTPTPLPSKTLLPLPIAYCLPPIACCL